MLTLGATYLGDGRCQFRVWAPTAERVDVCLQGAVPCDPIALQKSARSYFEGVVDGIEPGTRYLYRLDGDRLRPDPASYSQPEGVHGPSQVVDQRFEWHDSGWAGVPLPRYVIYEIHPGTFTPEGTFDAIIPHLPALQDLGITAIELMPVAQFPGVRNWGYDGTYPFAVQSCYGGVDAFKRLVDACHGAGLAVILDVVYNHLGPEGNYLAEYGPYFTARYQTPWGSAINLDDAGSDEVRKYLLENACYFVDDCHVDALRLDAVHSMMDVSATPFLAELATEIERLRVKLDRRIYLFAETDRNDPQLLRSTDAGGYGLDAQWSDDFHHALHARLTGERDGYYADFGALEQVAKALREGFVFTGEHSAFRQRRQGALPGDLPPWRLVVCGQNHDQVGNRMLGERLSALVPLEDLKLAASVVLLSPYVPLLFMGEEYGETAPFLFFADHSDPALIEAVRQGRVTEFAAFAWRGEVPDPFAEETFRRCVLCHDWNENRQHGLLREFYRELIRLRREVLALALPDAGRQEVIVCKPEEALVLRRQQAAGEIVAIFGFADTEQRLEVPVPAGAWQRCLASADARWGGPGCDAPERLESRGKVTVPLAPHASLLYCRA